MFTSYHNLTHAKWQYHIHKYDIDRLLHVRINVSIISLFIYLMAISHTNMTYTICYMDVTRIIVYIIAHFDTIMLKWTITFTPIYTFTHLHKYDIHQSVLMCASAYLWIKCIINKYYQIL